METELLTIKDVAKIVNVTPQSIYQKLNNQLKNYVVKDGNITRLKATIISEYYNASFSSNFKKLENTYKENSSILNKNIDIDNNIQANETILKKNKENSNILNDNFENNLKNNKENSNIFKDDIINFFKEQIIEKDNIIKEKDLYIKELTEKITDLTERLAILFENSQQLQKNQQLLEAQNIISDDIETSEIKEKKQSFIKRLFKK